MKFYTNAIQWGNFLLIREVNNGERRSYRVKYSPTLYAQVEKPTNFKTLSGKYTTPIKFDTIKFYIFIDIILCFNYYIHDYR